MNPPNQFDHIKDPALQTFYMRMHDYPFENIMSYDRVNESLTEPNLLEKRLALMYATRECIRVILSDLDEHGAVNQALYGGLTPERFQEKQRLNDISIAQLEKTTHTDIFSEWKRKYDAYISGAADEFVDEIETVEEKNKPTIREIAAANGSIEKTLEILSKFIASSNITDEVATAVNGITSNAILQACKAGDYARAMEIVSAYSDANTIGKFVKGEVKNQEMLITHMLAAPGFTKNNEDMNFVLDELGASYDLNFEKFPRAYFNLACLYALLGKKKEMLDAIAKAKKLGGKTEDEFLADDSFKNYFTDPDFVFAVKNNEKDSEGGSLQRTEEFAELMIWMDKEVNTVANDLYGAVKHGITASSLSPLLGKADALLVKYQSLKDTVKDGELEELLRYERDITDIEKYLAKLKK